MEVGESAGKFSDVIRALSRRFPRVNLSDYLPGSLCVAQRTAMADRIWRVSALCRLQCRDMFITRHYLNVQAWGIKEHLLCGERLFTFCVSVNLITSERTAGNPAVFQEIAIAILLWNTGELMSTPLLCYVMNVKRTSRVSFPKRL